MRVGVSHCTLPSLPPIITCSLAWMAASSASSTIHGALTFASVKLS